MAKGRWGRPRVQTPMNIAPTPSNSNGIHVTVTPEEFPVLGNPIEETRVNEVHPQSCPVTIEQHIPKSSYASMVNPEEGLALKLIEAPVINGTKCTKIERSDIAPEIKCWNQAILCCVMGTNPPPRVIEGFVRRIWNQCANDKVIAARKGLYLVWFKTMADKKEGYLSKQTNKLWKKTFLSYARLLIDISLEGPFMEYVDYINDKGRVTRQRVKYEWQPMKCDLCSMYGHIEEECRKKKVVKQEWRVVNQEKEKGQEQQDISIEFVTPRRTARRPSPNMRGLEEPATTSFLTLLQKPLQQLNGNRFKDIHNQLAISKAQLEQIQNQLQHDPGNNSYRKRKRKAVRGILTSWILPPS
ncbi:hypothetical protein Cgig2_008585 [Carnegiea gigantea]|uniref:DUF4283 domain-containing protein n=1 Tax=Carnegiea gigantea TaxID=171969 RepID=A0A9Q1JKS8_9CARY|nr:hypothetical protein Cgig2_008585 [Carnegiea gigantea]